MKKMMKDVKTLGITTLGIGGLGMIGGAVGMDTRGIATLGKAMPLVATATMGKHVIRLSSKMIPKRKRR